ncbi:hypothetical protein [Xanthomonas albilineans]|uniref:hypothetical protein n=1 Tax=Xanthomonas albilineans TaxID=29447 RepID=UPI0005F319AC|nr:hypothetical protein [Xanthomonas albilineans]
MRTLIIPAALILSSLLFSQIVSADSLDFHIRTACPDAAAWKDQHETPAATQVTGHAATAPTRPALRDELKSMADRDQQARNAWQADGDVIDSKAFAKMQKVDAANLTRLRACFQRTSLPPPKSARRVCNRPG